MLLQSEQISSTKKSGRKQIPLLKQRKITEPEVRSAGLERGTLEQFDIAQYDMMETKDIVENISITKTRGQNKFINRWY